MADLATLRISVDASGAIRVVDQFGKATESAAKKSDLLTGSLKRTVLGFATFGTAALVLRKFVTETAEAQRVQAQLTAAIRSTGGAAGQSLEALNKHAAALQRMTAFGDEAIGSAQALLLTFTKIQGGTFSRATEAVLDLAQALGGDLQGAALQVGKALNDPILGVTALGRAGVQFSESQKAMIKSLVETNRLAEAQGIILKELETQTGGSAKAYRNTLGGALAGLSNAWGEAFEITRDSSDGMIRAINALADALPRIVDTVSTTIEGFIILGGWMDRVARFIGLLEDAKPAPGSAGAHGRAAAGAMGAIGGRVARYQAGYQAGIGGTPSAGVPDPVAIVAAAEAIDKFNRNLKAMTKAVDEDTSLREKQDARTKTALAKTAEAVQELSESARVFQEQTQIALGQFFSDFLNLGATSLKSFFQQFAQLGRDTIGNALAKAVMDSLGPRLKEMFAGAFTGMAGGVFGGVLGAFISGITGATNALEKMVAATNRAIADFARRPLDAQLTDAQRQMQALEAERDALVRRALGDRGMGNLEGSTFETTRYNAQSRLRGIQSLLSARSGSNFSITGAQRTQLQAIEKSLQDALTQIDAIGNAFDANSEAIRRNIVALENAAKAEAYAARIRQAATLQEFRDGLNLSAQSPLSPTAQLAEARRQYEVILALAKGGDQSAISSLPETARTLLDASRAVNASGVRYAQDFAKVQADTALIIDALRMQTGKDAIDVTDTILERTEPWFADALATADASLVVQQTGFQSVVDELVAVRSEISNMKKALVIALDEVAAAG